MKNADWEFRIQSEENRLFAVVEDEATDLLILVDINEPGSDSRHSETAMQVLVGTAIWCNEKTAGLRCGLWRCDQKDGEVRFKDAADVENVVVSVKFMDNVLRRVA
jgi:hypothetical protein